MIEVFDEKGNLLHRRDMLFTPNQLRYTIDEAHDIEEDRLLLEHIGKNQPIVIQGEKFHVAAISFGCCGESEIDLRLEILK